MSEQNPAAPDADPTPSAAMRFNLLSVTATAGLVAAFAFAMFDVRTGLGALLGGALAVANLWIMARVAKAFIAQRGATPWAAVAVIKLVVLLGAVWLVLKSGVVPPLSLVLGYASLPVGITVGSLFGPKPPETPPDEQDGEPPTHEGPPSR